MKFERTPLDRAAGSILAHSVSSHNFSYKKGHLISGNDITLLKKEGLTSLFVARLEGNDVPEDEAANAIAQSLSGPMTATREPFTGRCNLYSTSHGLVQIDKDSVNKINTVDESITVATLPEWSLIDKEQMLATVKIIPFAAPKMALERCLEIANTATPLVQVAPLKSHDVGIILTTLGRKKESVLKKTVSAVNSRIESLGSNVRKEIRCDHNEKSIANAILELLSKKCSPILIYGASAIVDRRDVIPLGIELSGGKVDHYGMPVDPGNLILLGHHSTTNIVGLPGCARSPKLNGFDWVLWRILADLPITSAEIQNLGVGGLLKEIHSRPQKRDNSKAKTKTNNTHRVTAIVLAAGRSTRMGGKNKLLEEVAGEPIIRKVVDETLLSNVDEVIVVLGHESTMIKSVLTNRPIKFVMNENFLQGISSSISSGIQSISSEVDGILILLGDMPSISSSHLDKIINSFNPKQGNEICVPIVNGRRGNPVLWGKSFFTMIQNLSGDVGAKELIVKYPEHVKEVTLDTEAIFLDIDTQEMLENYRNEN